MKVLISMRLLARLLLHSKFKNIKRLWLMIIISINYQYIINKLSNIIINYQRNHILIILLHHDWVIANSWVIALTSAILK